jgi:hypothetical protein
MTMIEGRRARSALLRKVDRAVRAGSRRHWRSAHAYGRAKAFVRWKLRPQPIVVYQMGKVASTTVAETIEHEPRLAESGVAHVHFLDPRWWHDEAVRARIRYEGNALADTHLWDARQLRRRLERGRPAGRGRWHVITLARDPVARNVSAFFQGAQRSGWLREGSTVEELRDLFYDSFTAHDVPLEWFDRELRTAFAVDVYESPFDSAAGFSVYESELARVLLLRVEDLRTVGPRALGEFFDLPELPLRDKNVGEEKHTGDLYRRFLSDACLDVGYLDRMYGSRYATHFYTADELSAFRRRWLEGRQG